MIQKLPFPHNDEIPMIGLGTWKAGKGQVYDVVKSAIKIGYRHIDCAAIYMNEKEIGNAIKECISEGIVKREDLWITSKLWNNNHGQNNVIKGLTKTLEDLQLDYLDLYLIHWPIAQKPEFFSAMRASHFISLEEQPISDTWKGMEAAVDEGLVKHIGVCNFSIKKLEDLIKTSRIKPTANQVELNPYFQQDKLVSFCKNNDVHVIAYSPLGSSDRPNIMKTKDEPVLLEDAILIKLAEQKGISIAQLILAWIRQRGVIAIPKSVNPERQKQNLDSSEITLNDDEMAIFKSVDKNRRYVDGRIWALPGGPYTIANLWDEE